MVNVKQIISGMLLTLYCIGQAIMSLLWYLVAMLIIRDHVGGIPPLFKTMGFAIALGGYWFAYSKTQALEGKKWI